MVEMLDGAEKVSKIVDEKDDHGIETKLAEVIIGHGHGNDNQVGGNQAAVIRVRANHMAWYGCRPYTANYMLVFLIAEATINLITRVPLNAVAAYCIRPFDHPSLDGRRNWRRKECKTQVGLTT